MVKSHNLTVDKVEVGSDTIDDECLNGTVYSITERTAIPCSTLTVGNKPHAVMTAEKEVVIEELTRAVAYHKEFEVSLVLTVSLLLDSVVSHRQTVGPASELGFVTAGINDSIALSIGKHTVLGVTADTHHVGKGMSCEIVHVMAVTFIGKEVEPLVRGTQREVDYITVGIAAH